MQYANQQYANYPSKSDTAPHPKRLRHFMASYMESVLKIYIWRGLAPAPLRFVLRRNEAQLAQIYYLNKPTTFPAHRS